MSLTVTGLSNITAMINKINKFKSIESGLIKYIGNKSLETLQNMTYERVNTVLGDDYDWTDYIDEYYNNHTLNFDENGFSIENSTIKSYSKYDFNISMAFEYGVGIIGEQNPKENAWEYNVNGYNMFWTFNRNGETVMTSGYEGMEIYFFATESIKNNLKNWTNEYLKEVGII